MATLGAKLLKLRQEHRLSQMEISEILGVSQNAYSRWEADKCKPLVENLFKISQHYQIDMRELLDDGGTINFSSNEINGGNNIIASNNPSINTVNIQLPLEIVEQVMQAQERITQLLDSQIKLVAELLKK